MKRRQKFPKRSPSLLAKHISTTESLTRSAEENVAELHLPNSLDEGYARELFEISEGLHGIMAVAVGQRTSAWEQGFSDEAAEHIAVRVYEELLMSRLGNHRG